MGAKRDKWGNRKCFLLLLLPGQPSLIDLLSTIFFIHAYILEEEIYEKISPKQYRHC